MIHNIEIIVQLVWLQTEPSFLDLKLRLGRIIVLEYQTSMILIKILISTYSIDSSLLPFLSSVPR